MKLIVVATLGEPLAMSPLDQTPVRMPASPGVPPPTTLAPPAAQTNVQAGPVIPYSGLPTVPQAAPPAPGVETLLSAIRQRIVLMIGLGLLFASMAVALTWFFVPGKYAATLLLKVGKPPRGYHESEADFINYVRSQEALLKSHQVLQPVLDKPEIAELREVQAQGEYSELWLQKNLIGDTKLGTDLLRITLEGDYPDELALILNELSKKYRDELKKQEESRVRDEIVIKESSKKELIRQLRDRRIALHQRETELGLDDQRLREDKVRMLLGQLPVLRFQWVTAQQERKTAEARLFNLRKQIQNITVPATEIEREMNQDYLAKTLLEQRTEKEKEINGYKKVGGNVPPSVANQLLEINTRLNEVRAKVEGRLRSKIQDDLKQAEIEASTQVSLQQGKEQAIEMEIQNAEKLLTRPEKVNAEVEGMRDEVRQLEKALESLGTDLASLQASTAVAPRVEVMGAAHPPTTKNIDRKIKFAAIAGVAAFGIVCMGIIMLEFRTRRVYTPDDVARGLGLNMMGTLPNLPGHARQEMMQAAVMGKLGPEQGALLESVDAIRSVILHSSRSTPLQFLMITSAGMGEGKTSLACNLAASLARSGRRTLLIDGDLRHPQVHAQMGLSLDPGLCEVLRHETTPLTVIRDTPMENLAIITAGRSDRPALQALSQNNLKGTFDLLRSEFDFIILDTSPVLPVADALMLGQYADAAVLSVFRNVSRLPAIQATQQRLNSLGIRILGTVMTGDSLDTYGVNPYQRLQLQS